MTDALTCVEVTLAQPEPGLDDLVEGEIWTLGPAGVERHDDDTWSALVEDPRPRALGTIRWRIWSEGDDATEALREQFTLALHALPVTVDVWVLRDLSYRTAWREHFRPARVSERIVVHPPWDVPSEGPVRIEIDPGMAFGTGTHETTRLCLAAVDTMCGPGVSVLDVGTGSGILAIAAAKLGAGPIVGTDNDPDAVRIAIENAEINGVSDAMRLSTDHPDDVGGAWDVVFANILPHILESLRDALWARVAPGGALVLSGILTTEAERMTAVFAEPGATGPEREDRGEWCRLTWRRPSDD